MHFVPAKAWRIWRQWVAFHTLHNRQQNRGALLGSVHLRRQHQQTFTLNRKEDASTLREIAWGFRNEGPMLEDRFHQFRHTFASTLSIPRATKRYILRPGSFQCQNSQYF